VAGGGLSRGRSTGAEGGGGRRDGAGGGVGGRREQRRGGWRTKLSNSEREERNREKKEPDGRFKRFIFDGQGLAAENKMLFSVAVSVATENNLIFGGCVNGCRK
jgi:hypothetical protein